MRRQVLFVHGGGEGAHEADARLVASLRRELGEGYEVRYPAMPNERAPDYDAWARVLEEETAALGEGPVLAGHSLGAAVLLRFLAERGCREDVAGVFLVAAPFFGVGGWEVEEFAAPQDIASRLPDGVPLHLYHGRDDEIVPFAHVGLYAKALPRARVRRLDGRDHQLGDDMTEIARDIEALERERSP